MTTAVTAPTGAAVPPPAAGAPAPQGPAVVIDGQVRIPAGIGDLAAFRSWAHADDFPEAGRIAYLGGTVWIDLTMEQLYSHNQVKGEVGAVLTLLVRDTRLGLYLPDGMRLSNAAADLSTVPDGLFASFAALQSGRLRQVAGRRGGVVELEGTPEMVLEVVSDSSVEKDTVLLPEQYRRAGVPEFWRIDARGELTFEILSLTGAGYVPAEEAEGWRRSVVFGRWFRLEQQPDPLGQPQFTLAVRP
jgi:Uma2 family endonuclease